MARLGRRDHTFTEYKREVTASAVAFRTVSESSDDPLPFYYPTLPPSILPPSAILSYPFLRGGNTLVIPLGLGVFMGGDDHIFSGGS
ncbi:hypothetical protein EVAR_26585_1 [Eumeta japonica]|uniref:Uncharacterized protein n=1 Tax=Eumeta variegata TaxID=151549 RepID=A0A4C1W5G7_EUMVA|nr:hypothetical protein EVAR_26585_1 [Eumeta japonica]